MARGLDFRCGPPRGLGRAEGVCEHLGEGNCQELESRVCPLTPPPKGSHEAIP